MIDIRLKKIFYILIDIGVTRKLFYILIDIGVKRKIFYIFVFRVHVW